MFNSIATSVANAKSALEFKLILYIVLGIVAIVLVNLLLDGIRKAIRGLDTAALGGIILWTGHKAAEIKIISVVSGLLYLIGGTLVAVGLLVFILLKVIRHKIAGKAAGQSGPPQPQDNNASDSD